MLFTAGCKKQERGGPSELRIATQPAPLFCPIFVAKQMHWLENDLKAKAVTIKWSSFVAGPPENESFLAGQQDVGVLGDTPAIIARSAGLRSRIIATSATGPRALALIARKDSTINSATDLRGHKVAVTKGSYAHHLLYIILKNAGLTPADITIIHLPPADLVLAFNKGDVDAAATWEPFLGRIELDGARRIADGTGIKQGVLVVIAMDEFAKEHPDLIEEVLRAYQRGYDFIKQYPQKAAELITSEVKVPPEQLEKLFAVFDFNPAITPGIIQELKVTEGFLRNNEISKGQVDIDTFIDASYLAKIGL